MVVAYLRCSSPVQLLKNDHCSHPLSTAELARGSAANVPSVDWSMDRQLHLVSTHARRDWQELFRHFSQFLQAESGVIASDRSHPLRYSDWLRPKGLGV
jgi:hypothetical protein